MMFRATGRMCAALRMWAVWLLAFASGWWSLTGFASGADAEWAKRLPKETAFVWHYSGSEAQREAFEKTAAFEAYFQSGLVPAFKKLAAALPWKIITSELSIESSAGLTLPQVVDVYGFLYQRGFTLAACFPEDNRGSRPYQLMVVPGAGADLDRIAAWAEAAAATSLAKKEAAFANDDADAKPKREKSDDEKTNHEKPDDDSDEADEKLLKPAKAKEIADNLGEDESTETVTAVLAPITGFDKLEYKGRTISRLHCRDGHAKVVVAFWQEGEDLLVYSGRQNIEVVIDKMTNVEESLIVSRSWQRAWPELEQPIVETSHVWCDVVRLLKRYGSEPVIGLGLPAETVTVAKLLKLLGVDEIESLAWRWGYHGRHLVDVLDVVTPQPRQGLLALYDQPTVSLDRLPPLPVSVRSFSIQSFDAVQTWDQSAKILAGFAAMLPDELNAAMHQIGSKFENENATELRRELFASLGSVVCSWSDTDQELLSLGRFNVAISVKDGPALQKTLDRLFELIQQQGVEFSHTASTRHGCPFYVFASRTSAIKPCVALCDGWLILGLQPQTVEATVLRAKGRLPRWEGDVAKTTGVEIPKSFSGLTWSDPRGTVRLAMSLLPWLADMWSVNAKEFAPGVDFSSLDIPPAELVAQPLFPNVTTTVASSDRIRWTSWSSTPMNDSLVMFFQSYAAIVVVAELWGEEPLEFLVGLVGVDEEEADAMRADDLDGDSKDEPEDEPVKLLPFPM
ncbi:MAG: hypothetical protein ACKV2Q_06380 [Planctomycetaceae bacterium]